MQYESVVTIESKVAEQVRFTISKMSFGRRIELMQRIRELGRKIEFLEAGDDIKEKMEATVLANEIDRLYLQWGLRKIQGLMIDGQEATPEGAIADGPEELCKEIVAAIKSECGLTEEERKN